MSHTRRTPKLAALLEVSGPVEAEVLLVDPFPDPSDPARIVVCGGFTQGLAVLAQALRGRGARAVAVESYGLPEHRAVVARVTNKILREKRDSCIARSRLSDAAPYDGAIAMS